MKFLKLNKKVLLALTVAILALAIIGCATEETGIEDDEKEDITRPFIRTDFDSGEETLVDPEIEELVLSFNNDLAEVELKLQKITDDKEEIDYEKDVTDNKITLTDFNLESEGEYKILYDVKNNHGDNLVDSISFFTDYEFAINMDDINKVTEQNRTMMQAFYWNMALDEAGKLGGDGEAVWNPADEYASNYPHEQKLWEYIVEGAEGYSQGAKEYAELGFTDFWLPPPSKSAMDEGEDFYRTGYALYDPWDLGEFPQKTREDDETRTRYGTKDELEAAIKALNDNDIAAHYDMVMNQRIGGDEEKATVQEDLGGAGGELEGGEWYEIELDEGIEFIISLDENGDNNEFFAEVELDGDDEIVNEEFISVAENEVWIDLADIEWIVDDGGTDKFELEYVNPNEPDDYDKDLGEVTEGKFRVNIRVWDPEDATVSNLRVGYFTDEAEEDWNWDIISEEDIDLADDEIMARTDFSGLKGRDEYYSENRIGDDLWNDFEWSWKEFNAVEDCAVRGGIGQVLFEGKELNDTIGDDFLLGTNVDYKNNDKTWDEYKALASWLYNDIGFDGFRVDAIKHIHTPFVQDWLDHVQNLNDDDIFIVGEEFSGLDDLRNVLSQLDEDGERNLTLFDFQLFFDFEGDNLANMDLDNLDNVGLVNDQDYRDRAVTFINNHDVDRDNYRDGVTSYKYQAYTYLLTREHGIPTVFWKDYYQDDMKEGLDKLLEARKYFAYGPDYRHPDANDAGVYAYTRQGLDEVEGTGLVMMISNYDGLNAVKELYSGRPNTTYVDYTGNVEGTVTTNDQGYGDFEVQGNEEYGWSVWVPVHWGEW